MRLGDVLELVGRIHAFDATAADLDASKAALEDVTRLAGWLESRRLAVVGRIGELSTFPEHHVAKAARTSQRAASKVTKRADTVAKCPRLADSLANGNISGDHVDAVSRALTHVEPGARDHVTEHLDELVRVAEHATPDEFERAVRKAVDEANAVNGESRLAQQRKAARLRTWTNRETGMWHIQGEFDPETG
jgi:hypothetical protein